jgi:hypothetical protein
MRWFDVDGGREYMTQQEEAQKPSRKVMYRMVQDGLRVARCGRRMWFCAEWIDEFLAERAVQPSITEIRRKKASAA